jgi:hypothetical protein
MLANGSGRLRVVAMVRTEQFRSSRASRQPEHFPLKLRVYGGHRHLTLLGQSTQNKGFRTNIGVRYAVSFNQRWIDGLKHTAFGVALRISSDSYWPCLRSLGLTFDSTQIVLLNVQDFTRARSLFSRPGVLTRYQNTRLPPTACHSQSSFIVD